MDPLSIATGVFSLLAACVKTGLALKDFYDSAALADTKVRGLLTEVESFTQVLRLMRDTLCQENIQTSLRGTGHISDHLSNLSTSIEDGQKTLRQLQETLEKANKSVSLLDGTRKHLRLRGAADEIAVYQQQIRSYRDAMQLTLQTIILWNQVSFRESAEQILPNLDDIQQAIRRIALDLNSQIAGLHGVIETNSTDQKLRSLENLQSLENLRKCMRSAASIVSSASTCLSVDRPERISVSYHSEFGDCFPLEPAETMLRWISSDTVYEFEEERGITPSLSAPNDASGKSLQLVDEGRESDQSDSDGELEAEMCQALLRLGKDKLASKEFEAAERDFRNCLSRVQSNGPTVSLHLLPESKSEIMALLLITYRHQEKWDEARTLLMEKIALESRGSSKHDQGVLADTLVLVEILLRKGAYVEALLYGRRALKSYRKLGLDGVLGVQNSLKLLCQVCKAAGNYDQEDAYGAILSDMLQRGPPAAQPAAAPSRQQPLSHKVSSKKTPLDRVLSAQRPGSAQSSSTEDTLTSSGSWISNDQSNATSISTKSCHRDSQSVDSMDPSLPYTEYIFTSSKSQKGPSDSKDVSMSPHHEGPILPTLFSRSIADPDVTKDQKSDMGSRSLILTHENFYKPYEGGYNEEGRVIAGSGSRRWYPSTKLIHQMGEMKILGQEPATGIHETEASREIAGAIGDSAVASAGEFSTSSLPLQKREPIEHDLEPLAEKDGPKDAPTRSGSPEEGLNAGPLQGSDVTPESPRSQQAVLDPGHKISTASNSSAVDRSPTVEDAKDESEGSQQAKKETKPAAKVQRDTKVPPKATLPPPKRISYPNDLDEDEGSIAVIASPGIRPNHAMRPGLTFSALMANHARSHLEEAAIEYFRAGKGNPPKPAVPKPRVPMPVSDYELLEWIGTHPNVPFDEQPNTATDGLLVPSLEEPHKILSKSATNLLDSGIFELPTELPERPNSSTGLHGSTSTIESPSAPVETSSPAHAEIDWIAFYNDLDRDVAAGGRNIAATYKENFRQYEADSYSFRNIKSPQSTTETAPSHAVVDDEDDSMLKTLIEMGYDRTVSLSALERCNHNLERTANYLASGMSEESISLTRSVTDVSTDGLGIRNVPQLRFSKVSSADRTVNSSVPHGSSLPTPVSFQTLVQLQSSASSSNLRQPSQSALRTRRSESSLTAPANSHKKSVSFDSAFSNNHSHNPNQPMEDRHSIAAESQQDELSETGRRLHRPMNPIATRWHTAGVELPTTENANDLTASFSAHSSSRNSEAESQRSPPGQDYRGTSVAGSPNVPAITFSDMLDRQVPIRRKVVICGDVFCGKSSLVSKFSEGVFPETYHSAEFEIARVQHQTGDKMVELVLWDTGGDLNFAPFREKEVYSGTHLVMICFSIDSPDSLDNAQELFFPEMRNANSSVRCVLVGLKKDLRYDTDTIQSLLHIDQRTVTPGQGQIASVKIGAMNYLECSAKTSEGVKEVFEAVAALALLPNDKLKKMRSFRKIFGRS